MEPGRLLAGEYPGHARPGDAGSRLERFLAHGVVRFADLTHPADGLAPYRDMLLERSAALGLRARYGAFPIPDMGVPATPERMRAVLEWIREGVESGEPTYVHCWGGIGRTGTVVGCWLVERGLSAEAALAQLRESFFTMPKSRFFGTSPQTDVQFAWVRGWKPVLGMARADESS